MSKVIIVESPSKSKTISKYVGSEYTVVSSKGHIRDLAISGKGGLGVDVDRDFAPTYAVSKDKTAVVKELKKVVKGAQDVFLATDPDREGEAISWHLAAELGLDVASVHRVTFNEVTKDAVLHALENPSLINMDLVRSQENRRILDRILGFKLSKLLQSKIKSKSAGRVQSVALKLIVEREKEVLAFKPKEYWTISATFNHQKIEFEAIAVDQKNKELQLGSQADAQAIMQSLNNEYQLVSKTSKNNKRTSKQPFITSTLQQEMANKFNFPAKKTMRIAQKLYEGVEFNGQSEGLITYMRTDSTRLNPAFVASGFEFIEKTYGKNYVGFIKAAKDDKNVQDAHEAIRVTNIHHDPESLKKSLTPDEYKVYAFIYARTLASLMAPAQFLSTTMVLSNNNQGFVANGNIMTFDGYLKVYDAYESNKDKILPDIKEEAILNAISCQEKQHFTKGPSRYSEATLIKEMESNGIGRPSTYATIIDTIVTRGYVELTKASENSKTKVFIPTQQGFLTQEKLQEHFEDLINVTYTAKMESQLDEIAQGKLDSLQALREFYDKFSALLADAQANMEKIAPEFTGENCPKCGLPLVYRTSKNQERFVGCSGYPTCDYATYDQQQFTGENCPECNAPLIKRKSRKGQTFIGCSAYPTCKYIKKEPLRYTGENCPQCNAPLVFRRGRFNKDFIACSAFPKCRYMAKVNGETKQSESETSE